ncbi:MAG: hypothetical protein M1813_000410 [Trichoglossum hirsutum]|nr:MAG: hypothetical protein M1813_000410 [Trichoglossum hirsutum]
MDNHQLEDPQGDMSFHLFPRLPTEIRLMIWKYSWPAPRIIGPESCRESRDKPFRILRINDLLTSLASKRIETKLPKERPNPVTLQVCHESRQYTLEQYIVMRHARSTAGTFYFSPARDILWFDTSHLSERDGGRQLEQYYGSQLHNFKRVLLVYVRQGIDWFVNETYNHMKTLLGPLDVILILFEHQNDQDGYPKPAEEIHAFTEEMKASYMHNVFAKQTQGRDGIARRLEFMGWDGNSY